MPNESDVAYYERPARYVPGSTVLPIQFGFKNKKTGEPVVPVAVCSQLKDELGSVVYEFSAIIEDSGMVTLSEIPSSATRNLQNGRYTHGVTYTLGGGRVVVYLKIGIVFADKGLAC